MLKNRPGYTFAPLAAALLLWSASAVHAQSPRASRSGTEAEVAAVRAVYEEVVQAAAAHRLARRDTTITCDEEDLGTDVTVMTDASGGVRLLSWKGGSDDHGETHRFYYDAAGRLRFLFVSRGAVNGTEQEERVYYAPDRRVVRHLVTLTHGPGYAFARGTPVWRPVEWVRTLCSRR